LLVQPYARVSTDDKGQDPRRQLPGFEAWAQREGVSLLPAVLEEHTADKEDPFERPAFVRACEQARDAGAVALLLEDPDRLTRLPPEFQGWATVEVRRRFGVKVWYTTFAVKDQESGVARIVTGVKATMAHEDNEKKRRRTSEGMKLKQDEGKHVGRPRKPLTAAERAQALRWQGEGWGARRIAAALSAGRGAGAVSVSEKERARRTISATTVRRALRQNAPCAKTPEGTTR
jgi:DNA invertase Pin-like site-specific DNA recombinase